MDSWDKLNSEIINCTRCPRLVSYIKEVARKKKKAFSKWEYWGKPVPGFGDRKAELFILGLAPAAHGANRTGRMFTGDASGDLLVKVLHKYGFANKPVSVSKDDGLMLKNCYLSASIRCAPPNNRPLASEIRNCSEYLIRELKLIRPKYIVLLGRIAYDTFFKIFESVYGFGIKKPKFEHGLIYKSNNSPYIILTYHPSQRNRRTGRLREEDFEDVFKKVKELMG
ncbi:MAG TPA: uracil-DNA glycosylase [Geobacterales bacterium]|nr:uracil-DNA glycosylase [Geobacterales bacterium]